MKVSSLQKSDLTREIVDRMLYEGLEDTGDSGECIMVLGSNKAPKYRVPKAVSLYQEKRAPKLLLCGGTVRETESGPLTEAAMMKQKALELGIPEEDILTEELSKSTKENMLCALLVLERTFKLSNVHKILLVTTD